MRKVLPLLYFHLLFSFSIRAQDTSSAADAKNPEVATESRKDTNPSAARLPVRRVVLYKNGVGYFEHLGHVRGSQGVHIDFTSAQLNDALKSLTVLDLSGGRIREWNTTRKHRSRAGWRPCACRSANVRPSRSFLDRYAERDWKFVVVVGSIDRQALEC